MWREDRKSVATIGRCGIGQAPSPGKPDSHNKQHLTHLWEQHPLLTVPALLQERIVFAIPVSHPVTAPHYGPARPGKYRLNAGQ